MKNKITPDKKCQWLENYGFEYNKSKFPKFNNKNRRIKQLKDGEWWVGGFVQVIRLAFWLDNIYGNSSGRRLGFVGVFT